MSKNAAWSAQCRDLAVIETEAGVADCLAEIPGGIPVRELEADSSLARHGGSNPLVERGQVEDLFGSQGMADRADPARVDVGLGGEHIHGPRRVQEHLGRAFHAGMTLVQPLDGRFCAIAATVLPEEVTRTERDISPPGEVQANMQRFWPFQPGGLANGPVYGRVEYDRARPPMTRTGRPQQVRLDR